MQRGFKSYADRLAVDLRAELGLRSTSPLNALSLADHLAVPVTTISDFLPDSAGLAVLVSDEPWAVSAVTVFDGSRRLIVVNDAHPSGRRNSDLMHELAHGLLLHPPGIALDVNGCRHWDGEAEEEADWLGGCLLIPSAAAWSIRRSGLSEDAAMARFGVSEQMLRWRLNMSGANRGG